ncbi:MAG: hypothetical protein M1834_007052 [Cirrosporium novae-zelandiae]|nr:MAG: hypothetical protein M1834_007052 [Cirrosporium novae-zelandiae]
MSQHATELLQMLSYVDHPDGEMRLLTAKLEEKQLQGKYDSEDEVHEYILQLKQRGTKCTDAKDGVAGCCSEYDKPLRIQEECDNAERLTKALADTQEVAECQGFREEHTDAEVRTGSW